ncbi:MAG TPA: hypothetical protein DIV86_05380 [Alphaproteobacteria bacterium]|nr:hypothetical protein [Alphaproteobacteria bacterium]
MEKLLLNKIEVAERQLETAVELFFDEKDCISIHNLASSSYQIIHDILRDKEVESLKEYNFKNNDMGFKEFKDFNKEVSQVWNFLKHANENPSDTLEFEPHVNDFLMRTAIHDLYILNNKISDVMSLFVAYFKFVYGDDNGGMVDITDIKLIDFNKRQLAIKKGKENIYDRKKIA